ncbi:MAG: hypothetical protein R6X15_02230 [Pseudomonadota bacterium]
MQNITIRTLPLLSLLLLGGCGGSDSSSSSNYTNTQIAPRITASQDQSGDVTTVAILQSSSGASLYLGDGDRLYASLNTPPADLVNTDGDLFETGHELTTRVQIMESLGTEKYYANESTDDLNPPIRAYVGFERGNGEWVGQTSVVIPRDFTILSPASYSSISRNTDDPITLSWTNVDETTTMKLHSRVICNNLTYLAEEAISLGADTGTAEVSASDYFPANAPTDINCHAVFTLERSSPERPISEELGTAGGSSIIGIKQKMVEFTSTP